MSAKTKAETPEVVDFKQLLAGSGVQLRTLRYYHPNTGVEGVRVYATWGENGVNQGRVVGQDFDYLQRTWSKAATATGKKIPAKDRQPASVEYLMSRFSELSQHGYLKLQMQDVAEVPGDIEQGMLVEDFGRPRGRTQRPSWFPDSDTAIEFAAGLVYPYYVTALNEEEVQVERVTL